MKQILMVILLFSTTVLLALSGTYSVGGSSADYSSLASAILAANSEGLSGNTEFILNPGTYSGPFTLQHTANGHDLSISSGSAPSGSVVLNNPTATSEINYIIRIEAVHNVKRLTAQCLLMAMRTIPALLIAIFRVALAHHPITPVLFTLLPVAVEMQTTCILL
jgi:hypothetical protein